MVHLARYNAKYEQRRLDISYNSPTWPHQKSVVPKCRRSRVCYTKVEKLLLCYCCVVVVAVVVAAVVVTVVILFLTCSVLSTDTRELGLMSY